MGTTTKKPARKKPSRKKARNGNGRAGHGRWPETLDEMADALMNVLNSYTSLCESVSPRDTVTQAQLYSAHLLDEIADIAGKARKAFDKRVIAHDDGHGAFETGRVAITFPLSGGRRNPAWKGEAVDARRLLAEEQGLDFDADDFVKQVQDRTTPGAEHKKVKLTISAG